MKVIDGSKLVIGRDYLLFGPTPKAGKYKGRSAFGNYAFDVGDRVPWIFGDLGLRSGVVEEIQSSAAAMDYAAPIYATPARKDHSAHEVVVSTALNKKFMYCRTCKEEVFYG